MPGTHTGHLVATIIGVPFLFLGALALSRHLEMGGRLALLMEYNFLINQAFAKIYVVASCAAIALWSFLMVKGRALSIGLAVSAAGAKTCEGVRKQKGRGGNAGSRAV